MDVEPTHVLPLVTSMVRSMSALGSLALDCPPELWVSCDPIRLQQMLGNLVSNAFKHGAAPVEVAARGGRDDVIISVRDHGAGVPAEFRERMFDQYSRAPGEPMKGLGLGLYLVRSLAEAQGGRVEYLDAEGGGAQFQIVLPAVQARTRPASDESPTA